MDEHETETCLADRKKGLEGVRAYIESLRATLDVLPVTAMSDLITVLHRACHSGRQIFIMGNGGSASTASHFACDLNKQMMTNGLCFRVVALTDSMPIFSAYANDHGFEAVFVEQLARFVNPDDIVIGISTSGNSENVLNAIRFANKVGALTVGFTGLSGGRLKDMVDLAIHVPNDCVEQVEDVHLMVAHLICFNLCSTFTQDSSPLSNEIDTTLLSPQWLKEI